MEEEKEKLLVTSEHRAQARHIVPDCVLPSMVPVIRERLAVLLATIDQRWQEKLDFELDCMEEDEL